MRGLGHRSEHTLHREVGCKQSEQISSRSDLPWLVEPRRSAGAEFRLIRFQATPKSPWPYCTSRPDVERLHACDAGREE
jgi:hypothetical protein